MVSANTDVDAVHFDVTTPADSISYHVKKMNTEQWFYVKGVYFSKLGVLHYYYKKNSSVYGTTAISASNPISSGKYVQYLGPNSQIELSFASSVSGLRTKGSFTP